jgi:DNA-binding MarR family transcriptional regulator
VQSFQSTPRDCTNLKIRKLARILGRYYDAEIGQAGLKSTQFALLSHVLQLGPVKLGDLATHMALDASTLTRNLKPLLSAGWIAQETGRDMRNRFLTLTQIGRHKQAEASLYWAKAQERIDLLLGSERASALRTLVDDCIHDLQANAP